MKSLRDIVASRAKEVVDLHELKEQGQHVQIGTPTGFRAFDGVYGGLPKTVVVLGADSGIGKSAIARAFAFGAARSGVGSVVLLNLEDGNDNFADRVIGERTGFGANRIRKLDFQGLQDRRRIQACADDVMDRIYLEEDTYDAEVICANVAAFHQEQPVGLVVVDYLQLLRFRGATSNTDRILNAMAAMQRLSKTVKAPVLCLSQVGRKEIMRRGREYYQQASAAGESGDERYEGYCPGAGDFHWASEIDQYAKMAMVAFRPGPYKMNHNDGWDTDTRMRLRVVKVNQGPKEQFTLGWKPELAQVYDLGE